MIRSLLIANRGEIACRIIRTARAMGVRTIAVYSDADAAAQHVRLADEAWRLGPAPARESYLKAGLILDIARRAGADAIHPGYGFLSENAGFAEACAKAGVIFVGPPASAIRAMGGKDAAKALMEKAGVPIVPGYHGEDQSADRLRAEAGRIGFPLLAKAVAGGGGKGMRLIRSMAEFDDAVAGAAREAEASFGDATLLLERYVEAARHIEVQVFADTHGNVLHLNERDCSVQRRHQKVLEEAPAPGMDAATRAAMGAAAVEAARAIGYVGAGTVEFIVDAGRGLSPETFFFMEMNTRLQVEHPVTEAITGLDLVEWQLRVASGEALPISQDEVPLDGHAIEARLYAEDVPRGFLPATGRLDALTFGAGVRIDSGVVEGDTISQHYDPMIAKLIAHGATREQALSRLAHALRDTRLCGLTTNQRFLIDVLEHPAFRAGGVETRFLDHYAAEVVRAEGETPPETAWLMAAAYVVLARQQQAARDPWEAADGFRVNAQAADRVDFAPEAGAHVPRTAAVTPHPATGAGARGLTVAFAGAAPVEAEGEAFADGTLRLSLDGRVHAARIRVEPDALVVMSDGATWRLPLFDALAAEEAHAGESGALTAPMSGRIVRVAVAEGAAVKAGDTILVLEAMKMEHTLRAAADGTVTALSAAEGDQVDEGAVLAVVTPDEDA
ncbi:MAG: biotin/lipoyl-binding protein [Alphaproteobacteria bacterium]|nr:biotin/lipoyl-binding protein [Alphaproteobacteria bacterium]MDX5462873.1 biotin/lipoyl-binding protein [Alphaproteobacteria bacterium]